MKVKNEIKWDEQFKIRLRRNVSTKHEVIKLNIVLRLLEKYKRQLYWIRIYTEHALTSNGKTKITDVYFENIKTNEIICYEIQNRITDDWVKETNEFYNNYDRIYFKTDWILIDEKKLPNDIDELNKETGDLII